MSLGVPKSREVDFRRSQGRTREAKNGPWGILGVLKPRTIDSFDGSDVKGAFPWKYSSSANATSDHLH